MSNVFFDMKTFLDARLENEMLKNESAKPIVLLLKKHGIVGMQAIDFVAELAQVVQQMQQGAKDE